MIADNATIIIFSYLNTFNSTYSVVCRSCFFFVQFSKLEANLWLKWHHNTHLHSKIFKQYQNSHKWILFWLFSSFHLSLNRRIELFFTRKSPTTGTLNHKITDKFSCLSHCNVWNKKYSGANSVNQSRHHSTCAISQNYHNGHQVLFVYRCSHTHTHKIIEKIQ